MNVEELFNQIMKAHERTCAKIGRHVHEPEMILNFAAAELAVNRAQLYGLADVLGYELVDQRDDKFIPGVKLTFEGEKP